MLRLLQQLLHLADGGGRVLAVDQFSAFEGGFQSSQGRLTGREGFLLTAVFLVGEILDEGRSAAAEGSAGPNLTASKRPNNLSWPDYPLPQPSDC